jgi:hypothetical protein
VISKLTGIGLLVCAMILPGGGISYAQQHEDQSASDQQAKSAQSGSQEIPLEANDAIFCPTMKTGQLCSHGTTNILQLKGKQADAWVALARQYNKAVNAATLQLFQDAEGVLAPQQVELLKAWFAVGLNPQINELLYAKGLGSQKNVADKKEEK